MRLHDSTVHRKQPINFNECLILVRYGLSLVMYSTSYTKVQENQYSSLYFLSFALILN